MSLMDAFERQAKKTYVFNGIRNVRASKREEERLNYRWTGRLSPSKLSLDMCIFNLFQEKIHQADQLKDYTGKVREDWAYFGRDGSSKHLEFQEDLRKLNLKRDKVELWQYLNPDYANLYLPEDKRAKFVPECIEIPLWFKWNSLQISAKVDHVLHIPKISNQAILGDFKTPHRERSDWAVWAQKNIPKRKDYTQVSIYAWIFNQNPEILGSKPEIGSLQYYNNWMSGDLDAEREVYWKVPLDVIDYFMSELDKEKSNWDNRVDSSCTNEFCQSCHQGEAKVNQIIKESLI